jgi:glycosyltransferase involved in cell wall biosynthesis
MKVVAISHSCITDVNQALYVALHSLADTEVELVVPKSWRSEYANAMFGPRLLPGVTFPVHALPISSPGNNSLHFYLRGLAGVLRSARPDIVFVDEEPWSLACAQARRLCARQRLPYVCYTKQNIYKQYPLPFRLLERSVYRSAAAIVALSEEVRAVLQRKGYRGACPLLAHACDLSLFSPQDSRQLRSSLGLNGFVVGYMGRFVPEKGLDSLVAALAKAKAEIAGRRLSLLLVGAGVEEDKLRIATDGLGLTKDVVFAGVVPHVEAGRYMNCMDAFVLPSLTTPRWKEQFGRVIVEAMACGVPVLGSDSGEIPYLIADTKGGLVFHEGNADDLAEKLRHIVTDDALHAELSRAGAASVHARYTYPAIAAELRTVMAQFATPSRGRSACETRAVLQ